jgi:hypothetical protein
MANVARSCFYGISRISPNPLRVERIAPKAELMKILLVVQAGMISGFDADTLDSFPNQYNFLQWAGIPMASITMLNAPEGTPLEKRLTQEKRLIARPMDVFFSAPISSRNR